LIPVWRKGINGKRKITRTEGKKWKGEKEEEIRKMRSRKLN